jgi:hypothetical protein
MRFARTRDAVREDRNIVALEQCFQMRSNWEEGIELADEAEEQ